MIGDFTENECTAILRWVSNHHFKAKNNDNFGLD